MAQSICYREDTTAIQAESSRSLLRLALAAPRTFSALPSPPTSPCPPLRLLLPPTLHPGQSFPLPGRALLTWDMEEQQSWGQPHRPIPRGHFSSTDVTCSKARTQVATQSQVTFSLEKVRSPGPTSAFLASLLPRPASLSSGARACWGAGGSGEKQPRLVQSPGTRTLSNSRPMTG